MASDNKHLILVSLLFAVAVVSVAVGFPAILTFVWKVRPPGTVSELGDAFNILNTIFAGLALLGVIVAIVLQSRELALQRKEIASTRVELSRTAKANEELWRTASQQLDREKDWSRTRVALDLYQQWHAPRYGADQGVNV